MSSTYVFGEKSAALIGLLVKSDGKLSVFGYQRPLGAPNDMTQLYSSKELQLKPKESVTFRLTLAEKQQGLLTIEPLGWTRAYEVNRMHFLGMFNPFGTDEIAYQDFGGINRARSIPANRIFDGTFVYDPNASNPNDIAKLSLTDVESLGQSLETISVSSFAAAGITGGVLIAIRVTGANYVDGCAQIDFTSAHKVDVTGASGTSYGALASLKLNKTEKPT